MIHLTSRLRPCSPFGSIELMGSLLAYAYKFGSPEAASIGSRCSQRAVRGSYARAPTWYKPVSGIHSYPYAPFQVNGWRVVTHHTSKSLPPRVILFNLITHNPILLIQVELYN